MDLADICGHSGCVCIIPQDPVLFSGTIHDCLDPFKERPDDTILEALNAVRLLKSSRGVEALEDLVAESGSKRFGG